MQSDRLGEQQGGFAVVSITTAFLSGFGIGFALLGWYHLQVTRRFQRLQRRLQLENLEALSLPLLEQAGEGVIARSPCKAEAAELKQLLQAAPIGFIEVDEDNQLLWCNPRACALLGINRAEFGTLALPPPRLLLEVVRSYELDHLIQQTRDSQTQCQIDWVLHPVASEQARLAQLKSRTLRGHGVPLADGKVGVFLEDRQELVTLAQQRDRWTSDVAHELKTPLTSIRLVAETLYPRLEPPLQNWVERLLQETIRLSNLVQDLLDLSHLEGAQKPTLNLAPVDLPKLVHSAWLSLEPLARRKQLTLTYDGPAELLLPADGTRLHRVLLNLLDNGIKYSPSGATVQVRLMPIVATASQEKLVQLEVIDQGDGFPEGTLPHVFERFYRADPSRQRSPDWPPGETRVPTTGSGLGLAIVRQIVESHGGTVQAQNHPETGGAWIQIRLPAGKLTDEDPQPESQVR